jgi:uncharacterized membrane protein YkvA (DUF1232 family)
MERLRRWAGEVQGDVIALYLAMRDPRVPWYAKLLAVIVVSYALSPIDLIPDFIPVLGYLDDLLFVPLGILLVIRLIPDPVMNDLRHRAREQLSRPRPCSLVVAAVVVLVWIAAVAVLAMVLLPREIYS